MNKTRTQLVILALLLMLLAGCTSTADDSGSSTAVSADQTSKSQKVTHDKFSLAVPQGWKETVVSASAFAYTVPSQDPKKPSVESANLIISPLPSGYEDNLLAGMTTAAKAMPGAVIIQQPAATKLGSADGFKMKYEVNIGSSKMLYTQLMAASTGSLYTITYICMNSCKYEADFDALVNSVEILK